MLESENRPEYTQLDQYLFSDMFDYEAAFKDLCHEQPSHGTIAEKLLDDIEFLGDLLDADDLKSRSISLPMRPRKESKGYKVLIQFRLPEHYHIVNPKGHVMNFDLIPDMEDGQSLPGIGGEYTVIPPDHEAYSMKLNDSDLFRMTFQEPMAVFCDGLMCLSHANLPSRRLTHVVLDGGDDRADPDSFDDTNARGTKRKSSQITPQKENGSKKVHLG
ncbi:hypothetical protein F4781DRAFT_412537 [Annulohypoxylon bovei var. microspora]|nr:hypothetical protein F4781DRAFT_412537 [Annulohypoxylon bovei var. microspora]